MFLTCATNNKAQTVLNGFVAATLMYGFPEKLRTDLGGENIEAWRSMIEHHGDVSSVIVGSSVHNERIERLWRDVHQAVLSPYKEVFLCLEREGALDKENEVDLFCLHEVFKFQINKSLSEFKDSWNSHSLSTEHNMSPLQLIILAKTLTVKFLMKVRMKMINLVLNRIELHYWLTWLLSL